MRYKKQGYIILMKGLHEPWDINWAPWEIQWNNKVYKDLAIAIEAVAYMVGRRGDWHVEYIYRIKPIYVKEL